MQQPILEDECMQQLILEDEHSMCADLYKNYFKKTAKHSFRKYKHVFLGGDRLFLSDYVLQAFQDSNALPILADTSYITPQELVATPGKAALFFFVDCTAVENKEKNLAALELFFTHMHDRKGSRCLVTTLLPQVPIFPGSATSLAEREYNFFIEQYCEKKPEIEYYLEVEALCRRAAGMAGLPVTLLRFSNIFAPDGAHTPGMDLSAMVQESYEKRRIDITDADCDHIFSMSYIRGACYSVLLAFEKARKGHIYNGDCEATSIAALKRQIHNARPDLFGLHEDVGPTKEKRYSSLSHLKLYKCGGKRSSWLATGVKHLVSYVTGEEFDTEDNVEFYSGKIGTIQALEMRILAEIDRICKENDINYFLAGGSLLGAIRSGGAIPWDDDLDIGMLRDDFEKFRKVCPSSLSEEFSYSSPKSKSHYTIHKVRLNSTYFSTNFSNKNVFEDGIFIDLLVYDRTSNVKLFQKMHGFILTAITTVMLIKWFNVPRKNYHYRFSKRMLPLLRKIPWIYFHKIFDIFAKLYRHKKDAKWLVDTVGKKVNDGPLPNIGLDEVVYVDFDGAKAPIPANPEPYLLYAYGPNYMQKPPLSQRRCPHNFARIDLGKYVFDPYEQKPFREVDLRGELYEKDIMK